MTRVNDIGTTAVLPLKPVVRFQGTPEPSTSGVEAPLPSATRVSSRFLHAMPHVNFGSGTTTEVIAPPKDTAVTLSLHGQTVPDPWRPLEDLDAPATTNWWKGQNIRLNDFIADQQGVIRATTKWHEQIRDYTRESMQSRYGTNYVFSRQSGMESQPTFYVRRGSPTAPEAVLLDPKTLSPDGTVSVGSMNYSPDGKIVAYTLSQSGSDWQTMRFKNVETGEDVFEELKGLRFTSATWDEDGKGVLYLKPLPESEAPGKHFATYHHTLGEPQEKDVQVYKRTDVENSFVGAFRLTEDDPMLLMSVSSGTNSENGILFRRPGATDFTEILPPMVASLSPFYRDGDTMYATTDLDAPRNRIVSIDLNNPSPANWKTIVAESPDPADKLEYGFVVDGKLLVNWSKGGVDAMDRRDLSGKHEVDVPIPLGSTFSTGQVRKEDKEFEMSIGGYTSPGTRYRYNVADNSLTFVKKSDIPRDLTNIAVVERHYATSKDGTKVPMWVIKPKNAKLDGSNPTILYGYGGFNNSLGPGFSYGVMHWVENGGIWVDANLRGGGEFGKPWYDAGRQLKKQNVFDDYIACAEKLIADKVTQPSKLAIMGGSNGGLLTAATSQQRPDLFGAVVSQVPVTDMLRFHTNNFGAAWMSDYGNTEKNPADFAAAMAYSPLHTVKPATEVKYPPTIVMTGDHDDRVAPWHSFKWVAERHDKGHADSTFLYTQADAGHGAGKPTAKQIEEGATRVAFLAKVLGMKLPTA